jgi:hypothetical protein
MSRYIHTKKVTLITLALILISNITSAQKNCQTSDWNWWNDNTQENWNFTSAEKGLIDWMGSPWTGPSRNVLSINNILLSNDYLPKNGWVLLFKDFGCNGGLNNPYFLLYNKYTGKIRLFMLLYNLDFGNGGIATMRWANENKTTSLLTHGTGESKPNSKYHTNTPISTDVFSSTTDKISNSFYSDKWFVADFDVAFDHLTPIDLYDYQLAIDVSAIQNSGIEMSGELEWITSPYSMNIDKSKIIDNEDDEGKKVKDYLADAKKITKKIPSEKDLKKIFGDKKKELLNYKTELNASFGNTKLSERYELSLTELEEGSQFSKFLTGVSKYSPIVGNYLDVGVGVFDFLSNKSNTSAQNVIVMPTVTHGSVTLSGQIRTERPIEPIIIGLPGTKQSSSLYTPYYNCPLGVIGLEKEPKTSIRKWTKERKTFPSIKRKKNGDDNDYIAFGEGLVYDHYKSIRIDEDLKIAINCKANVEVIDIKAAICGKVKKKENGEPEYLIYDDYASKDFYNMMSEKLENPYKYDWTEYLNDNIYKLTSINEKGVAEFSTPLINIEHFKGVSFTVKEETDLYLEIIARLRAKDPEASPSPITLLAKYKLSEPSSEDDSSDKPYPFSRIQIKLLDSESEDKKTIIENISKDKGEFTNWEIETKGKVHLLPRMDNIELNAYKSITLKPGFYAKPLNANYHINMKITNSTEVTSTNYTPIENIVKDDYFCKCNCKPNELKSLTIDNKNSFDKLVEKAEEVVEKQFSPVIYPSPTNGTINISGLPINKKDKTYIHIFNSIGDLVLSKSTTSNQISLDLSNRSNGLYIVKIKNNHSSKTLKIMKR